MTFVVLDLARMFRAEFERAIADSTLELTPAEARVLAHLARHAPTRLGALAGHLGMSSMSVTEFAGKLEAAGYVERMTDPDDGRAKIIRLTDKADSALMVMRDIGDGIRRTAKGAMADDEWRQLKTLLKTARTNLGAKSKSEYGDD